MKLFGPTTRATPKRLQSRAYVFAVSALAVLLTILALIRPKVTETVAQVTLTVPRELAPNATNDFLNRVKSTEFLRQVAVHYGIQTPDAASNTHQSNRTPSDTVAADWAAGVRDMLGATERPSSAENAVDIVLQYRGFDGQQSVSVLNSLVAILVEYDGSSKTGGELENGELENIAATNSLSPLQRRAAERRLGQTTEALELFVNDQLARFREEHLRSTDECQIHVSLDRDAATRDEKPIDPLISLAGANSAAEARRDVEPLDAPQDWLTDQRRIDEQNQRIRNPEHDVIVRALVKSQAERQELLTRFPADHAAIRRIEVEIGDLELLARHTEKYLNEPVQERSVASSFRNAASESSDYVASFDEAAALAAIRQSEAYQKLEQAVAQSRQELAVGNNDSAPAVVSRIVVSEPPELVDSALAELPRLRLLQVAAISLLIGFVLSRLGDSTSVPDSFYSIDDVRRTLKIPVLGQLAMDNTPSIPQPELVASPGLWRIGVRLAEAAMIVAVIGFFGMLFTNPSLWSETFRNPVTAYMHAFHDLRTHVPIPYLFN